jgi:transposase-like protein
MKKEKGLKRIRGFKPAVFEESFKIALAREYLNGQLSFNQLAKKYNVPSGDTVRYFVRWYNKWLQQQNESGPIIASVNPQQIELQQKLDQANLRITALEMLIQNAEEELGIDITKKFGTKQQGK